MEGGFHRRLSYRHSINLDHFTFVNFGKILGNKNFRQSKFFEASNIVDSPGWSFIANETKADAVSLRRNLHRGSREPLRPFSLMYNPIFETTRLSSRVLIDLQNRPNEAQLPPIPGKPVMIKSRNLRRSLTLFAMS